MSADVFVDTNVLVYVRDATEPAKQKQAQAQIFEVERDGEGFSAQRRQPFDQQGDQRASQDPEKWLIHLKQVAEGCQQGFRMQAGAFFVKRIG